jgi:O-antigen ligase
VKERQPMSSLSFVGARPHSAAGPIAEPGWVADPAKRYRLSFGLFLALNTVLFLRPAELLEPLAGWPVFEILIVPCLCLALGAVVPLLSPAALLASPINLCVLGLLPVVIVSSLVNAGGDPLLAGMEYAKLCIYYFLLVSLVNSTDRLRLFLLALALSCIVLIILVICQYHGLITLAAVTSVQEKAWEEATAETVIFSRMRGTGLFNDPNEFCLIVILGMGLSLYWASEQQRWLPRLAWLAPLGVFAYAIALTQSRGGFVALLAAIVTYCSCKLGKGKTILFAVLILPLLLLVFAGRQTHVSFSEDTAQQRLGLWSDGLVLLRQNPVFGIGYGNFVRTTGLVAHNSFLHAFTELGLPGGLLFLGAFYVGLRELLRLREPGRSIRDPALARLYPCLFAGITGYVIGMLAVSYCYIMPTYTVLGIITVYLACATTAPPIARARVNGTLMMRVVIVGMAFLLAMYGFVRLCK